MRLPVLSALSPRHGSGCDERRKHHRELDIDEKSTCQPAEAVERGFGEDRVVRGGPCSTYRISKGAGLGARGWHVLRHTFGTHAARFGVNPWQLMEWMGHKRIDETMGYVHVAGRHRALPSELVAAGMTERIRSSACSRCSERCQIPGELGGTCDRFQNEINQLS